MQKIAARERIQAECHLRFRFRQNQAFLKAVAVSTRGNSGIGRLAPDGIFRTFCSKIQDCVGKVMAMAAKVAPPAYDFHLFCSP